MNFKNNSTAKQLQAQSTEGTDKPSKTVPDQTMSLEQLLKRHASGQNITVLQPEYQANDSYDDLLAQLPAMNEMDRLDLARKMKAQGDKDVKALTAWQKNWEKEQADKEKERLKAIKDNFENGQQDPPKPEEKK